MSYITDFFKSLLGRPRGPIQTFTFYLPAPPQRSNGYREKQFDELFYHFLQQGLTVRDFKVQAHGNDGLWLIFLVQGIRPSQGKLNLSFDEQFEEQKGRSPAEHIIHGPNDEPHA